MILWGGIEPRVNDAIMIASCVSKSKYALLDKVFTVTMQTYYPDFAGARVFDLDTGLEVIPHKIAMANIRYTRYGKRACQLIINAVRTGNLHYRFYAIDSLEQISKEYRDLTLIVK